MRVLLTGASGFIGAHVAYALLNAGCDVAALAIPEDPLWRLQNVLPQMMLLRANLFDPASYTAQLEAWKPEACIHLAWYAEPGKYLQSPENVTALTSSLQLIQTLLQVGCGQMVAAGTCAEYDAERGWLKEDGPTRPETIYAAAKLSFCLLGEQLARAGGMTFAWARIFYPYGPQEDPRRMVPALIRSLLAGEPFPATQGQQVRDYLHVADIARAFLILMQRKASGIYNVGSGVPITVRQLMDTVGQILGKGHLIRFGELPYREWDPRFICADVQKLRSLGWSPHYTLHEGLEATVDWWRHNQYPAVS